MKLILINHFRQVLYTSGLGKHDFQCFFLCLFCFDLFVLELSYIKFKQK